MLVASLGCLLLSCVGQTEGLPGEDEMIGSDPLDLTGEESLREGNADLPYTREYVWRQGERPARMGSAYDRVCFLTMMSGRFAGRGEQARVYVRGDSWYLGGRSDHRGVTAAARCLYTRGYSEALSWRQEQSGPTYLAPDEHDVCFLTMVTGNFGSSAEWVHVYRDGGAFYLSGGSNRRGVGASARCTKRRSYSDEYSWTQNSAPTDMGPADGRVCALARVAGNFQGGGELVRVYVRSARWYLGGSSEHRGVSASARCF